MKRFSFLVLVLLWTVVSSGFLSGCVECGISSDCPAGQICASGTCIQSAGDTSGTDPDTEGESDTDTDSGTATFCEVDEDCDDGKLCTVDTCSLYNQCVYWAVPEGLSCSDGLWCNGADICQAGECVAGPAPCPEADDLETPCRVEGGCDEVSSSCLWEPVAEGDPCGDSIFCFGGETQICQGGLCVDPTSYPDPCPDTYCVSSICDFDEDVCVDANINEGGYCYESGGCSMGLCAQGACEGSDDPCSFLYGGNPCTVATCDPADDLDAGLPYTCVDAMEVNDTACDVVTNTCDGSDAYCYQTGSISTCIPGQTRPCYDCDAPNFANAQECIPVEMGSSCLDLSPPIAPFELACGENIGMELLSLFRSRDYYSYSGACSGLDYRGQEAVFKMEDAFTGGEVTFNVLGTFPDADVTILLLENYEDPATCLLQGTNSLFVASMSPTDEIIIESDPGFSPLFFDIFAVCQ